MKAERWQQVEEIFHAAPEREPQERSAFLTEACEGDAVRLADLIYRQDVRVVQGRGRRGLLLESPQAAVVMREIVGQQLECDASAEPRVPGQIDFAHSSCAERRDDAVAADHLASP